ncbi:AraC family transcriptional regulator [Quadrisphaera sp. KR29]|uniref:AraC family transcriptional regulator n=1 Tax=Quadrisphaera sp. KR29 TaxID=3461391 RepID=UPI004044021A
MLVEGYRSFSTAGLPPEQRVARWEEHNASALIELSARTLDGSALEGREAVLDVGGVHLAGVAASAHVVERSARQIAASGVDGVALYFALRGESFFHHGGGVQLQRPGTLLVCDVGRPFLRGFAHGLEELVVQVPRATFEEVAGRSLPAEPLVLDFGDAPGGAHAAALARLVRAALARPGPGERAAAQRQLGGLLHAVLHGSTTSADHRRAALAHVERHLGDHDLSVGAVARAVGLSERHLARVFSEDGTSVARVVLERRLELAHRLLSAPGRPAVSAVAARCGFVSASHFARVFRERYGCSPGEVRAGS